MKALVTGGTGFVGRPFVSKLLDDGWQVTLLARDKKRAAGFLGSNLIVFEADVSDAHSISHLAQSGERFDVVFHLAASLNYFGTEQEVYRTNVEGTRNILNLALKTSAQKFIYASSIEAVGPVTIEEVPAPADIRCRPVSPYGRSKVLAEKLVVSEARNRFPVAILRIGNVYGPNHFSFILEIAEAILKRNRLLEFLPVYAGRYIHPAHNDDVTEGILAACRSDVESTTVTLAGPYATVGELFQICAGVLGRTIQIKKRKTVDEIYLLLRRQYHKRRRTMDFITYLMAGRGRRIHRAYSLQGMREVLGFSPQIDLRTGVTQTLQWAKEAGLLSS